MMWRRPEAGSSNASLLPSSFSDYRRGMEICRREEVLYDPAPRKDSVWLFHRRIAAAFRARGDEDAARRELERAASVLVEHQRREEGKKAQ